MGKNKTTNSSGIGIKQILSFMFFHPIAHIFCIIITVDALIYKNFTLPSLYKKIHKNLEKGVEIRKMKENQSK